MPYSPPAGLAVNFVRDQAAHIPPLGNHVDFHGYTEASYVLTGNGKVRFGGGMDTYSAPVCLGSGVLHLLGLSEVGIGTAAAISGELAFSGTIDAEVVIPTIDAAGPIGWGGSVDVYVVVNSACFGEIPWGGGIDLFTRPPRIDIDCFGSLPAFGGGAAVLRGENVAGAGKLRLSGGAAIQVGRVGVMAGKIIFGGAAAVRRGVAADLGGTLRLSGEARSDTEISIVCSIGAALRFSGEALAILPVDEAVIAETVAVIYRPESTYVME